MAREPLSQENRTILVFTISYMILFTGIAIWRQNVEFLYYMALMTGLVVFVVAYHRELHMRSFILAALSLVGLLHVAGGNVHVNGRRLYETYLVQDVIRYDNLVHSIGIMVVTVTLYSALVPHMDKTVRGSGWALSTILVLMAMGIGAFIEVVEFGAVAFLDAHEEVGGYWNNALDLTFNLVGSLLAVAGIQYHRYRERQGVTECAGQQEFAHPSAGRRAPAAMGRDDGKREAGSEEPASMEKAWRGDT